MTILYPHVLPFGVISNGSFTPLHTNLPGLEAAPEVTLTLSVKVKVKQSHYRP
jgi:hypothetical protein